MTFETALIMDKSKACVSIQIGASVPERWRTCHPVRREQVVAWSRPPALHSFLRRSKQLEPVCVAPLLAMTQSPIAWIASFDRVQIEVFTSIEQ